MWKKEVGLYVCMCACRDRQGFKEGSVEANHQNDKTKMEIEEIISPDDILIKCGNILFVRERHFLSATSQLPMAIKTRVLTACVCVCICDSNGVLTSFFLSFV